MKFSIHPLFFVFGLYFALTGKVFLFLASTLTALLHEFGHAICAERLGYKMNKISLMPYGAVVNGAIGGLSPKDELSVAMSGPLVNLCACTFFAALWWLVPESYPYTDTAFFCNLSIAAVNLLPAYPLDGGRVLCALLSQKIRYKTALLITRISGGIIGFFLLGLFVYSIFNAINLSLLFFSLFLLFGAFFKGKESSYVKTYANRSFVPQGVKESKKLVVSSQITLKQLLIAVSDKSFFELEITCEKSGASIFLNRAETLSLLSSYRLYDTVGEIAEQCKSITKVGL